MAETDVEEVSLEGSKKRFAREELEDITIESDDIPIRGSPEEFLILIDELKGTGTRQIGDINDTIDDFGRTNLSANVKYGENLGFIERTADGIILTEEGVELAYVRDNDDDLSTYFVSGLQQEGHYLALLLEFEGDSDYQSQIKNSDVLQVMYTSHSLREEKDSVLKRATSILFETLELAGYGEVKEASGGLPTRFNFSDPWTIDPIIQDLVINGPDEEEKPTEDKTESDLQGGKAGNIVDEPSSNGHQNEEELENKAVIDEIDGNGADSKDVLGKSRNDKRGRTVNPEKEDHGVQEVSIDIDLHIDVNEMDSAELEKKIEHINNLIR